MAGNRKHWNMTLVGCITGLALAACLELWRQYAAGMFSLSGEGVSATSFLASIVLGFPVNLLTPWLVDLIAATPGISPNTDFQYVMLAGVVANWIFIGFLVSRRRSTASE